MAQPRYSAALQEFIRQWRPHEPELDKRFIDAIRQLVEAILRPPAGAFEVETILAPSGGKVILRLGDYEAQLAPLDAQHLALSLVEAAHQCPALKAGCTASCANKPNSMTNPPRASLENSATIVPRKCSGSWPAISSGDRRRSPRRRI